MNVLENSIRLAISPCPNDTYIFGAWINGLLDNNLNHKWLHSPKTDYFDIEELNNKAESGEYDVIKVSAAYTPYLLDHYDILTSGSALGENVGPLFIGRPDTDYSDLSNKRIVIPGVKTTANLLFKYCYPTAPKGSAALFSKIEDSILKSEFDAGIIIHESRFTYQSKGLILIKDLGQYWFETTKLPIPLGLILIRKSLSPSIKLELKSLVQNSIVFANNNLETLMPYILSHAQEMEFNVVMDHINTYVNGFSFELGTKGKEACTSLFRLSKEENENSVATFV